MTTRKYHPIWQAIKVYNYASVAADPALHKRIAKAVRKEKCNDKGWSLLQLEDGKKWRLDRLSKGSLLTFTLVDVTPVIYTL
jgi:hypothetical protein